MTKICFIRKSIHNREIKKALSGIIVIVLLGIVFIYVHFPFSRKIPGYAKITECRYIIRKIEMVRDEQGSIPSPLLLLVIDGQLILDDVLDWYTLHDCDGLRIGTVNVVDIIEGKATRTDLINEWQRLGKDDSSWEVIGDYIVNIRVLESQNKDSDIPLIIGKRQREGSTDYVVIYANYRPEVVADWSSWLHKIRLNMRESDFDPPPECW